MMPKTDRTGKDKDKRPSHDAIDERLPTDSSSQTDEDILTNTNPEEERTVESERPNGEMRK